MSDGELVNQSKGQEASKKDRVLTPKGRLFLSLLCDGMSTWEAYKQAGYRGEKHTAYEMKRQLRTHLKDMLESRGFSIEGVAQELLQLSTIPLRPEVRENGLTLNDKLKILKLYLQALPKQSEQQPVMKQVTAFVINRGQGPQSITVDTTAESLPAQPKEQNESKPE